MQTTYTRERRDCSRRLGTATARSAHRAARRLRAIAVKANTEPTELLIALSMLQSAMVLVFFRAVPPLPFPAFFGHALGTLGLVGVLGLALRSGRLRLGFAFFGLIVRAWMTILYILRDPHDPAWVSLAMAAAALIWILVRMRCLVACPFHRRSFINGGLRVDAG